MKRPKKKAIRVVVQRGCKCEAYPFCEHAPNTVKRATERDDFHASIEADNGIHVHVSSGDIEGASDTDSQACLLQIGTEMGGYTCAYLEDDDDVRQLITNLTNYLACKPRGAEDAG